MQIKKSFYYYFNIGTEKNNDDCRRFHLNKSNKWDAASDVLKVMKWLERLRSIERTPRNYTKRKNEYWHNDIKEKRENNKRRRLLEKPDESDQPDLTAALKQEPEMPWKKLINIIVIVQTLKVCYIIDYILCFILFIWLFCY